MFLDIFRCLQKLIIIVNIVTGNHVIQRHIRTQLNIYDGDFFVEIMKDFQPSTDFSKRLDRRCSTGFTLCLWTMS